MKRHPWTLSDLHPEVRHLFAELNERLRQDGSRLFPFEGYRPPARQLEVFQAGASKVGPWASAHQYGLATDYAARQGETWTWDISPEEISQLQDLARRIGLAAPIAWDPCHIEARFWPNIRKAL